jgi:MFS family permease
MKPHAFPIALSATNGGASILVVASALATAFTGSTLLTPLYGLYQKGFGFSRIVLTVIFAVYVIGNLCALLFFGRVSDVIGRRITTMCALTIAALSAVVFLFAQSTTWLFFARALSGFAIGVISGTTTAWLSELHGTKSKSRATLTTSSANMIGLAVGPILAGALAQYAPWPLHLSYIVYILALTVIALLIWRVPETVDRHKKGTDGVSLKPRVGVPTAIRAQFIAPAVTLFVVMALVGFYAALMPGIIVENLRQTNLAISGSIVAELFAVAAVAVFATQGLSSRTAMFSGLLLLIPSLVLLVLAQAKASTSLLLLSTTLGGISAAMGYRGGLNVINEIAPHDHRAEVLSSYLVVGFIGNSLPVIGVGVASSISSPLTASILFAVIIAALSLTAVVVGWKYIPRH